MNSLLPILQFIAEAVWQTLPLFMISIFLSALVNALKLDGVIRRAFDARVGTAIIRATAVGAFSPFCSCTVIPVIAGLLTSGVPLAPIMAFWVASPTMDPEIFTLSVAILGWPLALARLGATLALSLAAGYATLALTRTPFLQNISILKKAPATAEASCCDSEPQSAMQPALALSANPITIEPVTLPLNTIAVAETSCCSTEPQPVMQPALALSAIPIALEPITAYPISQTAVSLSPSAAPTTTCSTVACATTTPPTPPSPTWQAQIRDSFQAIQWPTLWQEVRSLSWELGRWLLLAFLLEALIIQFIPQSTIAGFLGESNSFAIPLAATIGIPLYLSNITALPIVAGLLSQGMQAGAAIAFLIAGPVTTIPAMTAVFGVVHRRIFALYLTVSLGGAILLGYLINLIL